VEPVAEQAALSRLTALDAEATAAAERSADVARRLAVAQGTSGGLDVQAAEAALAAAVERHQRAATAAAAIADATTERERRRAQREAADALVRDLETRAADTAARLDEASTSVQRKRQRLHKAIGADETVETLAADLAVRLAACVRLAETEAAALTATEAVGEHDERLREAMAGTPFTSVDDVRAASLSDVDTANAEALNRSARAARDAAERSLADPVLAAAAAAPVPDVDQLNALVGVAHDELIAASGLVERLTTRLSRLEQLGDQLQAELDRLCPLLQARDIAASVASMCAGTSPDNQTRTRLSHYVLGERLRQVVEAANERLAGIASGRYELVHTMDRGVGDTRGGLSLRVYDAHTGRERDPATLSGGESFFVSLALALGLADLVRDEVGGLELSTLFVDEGFGMLDAETLDEVMDALDSLRAGGRAVGIVSHLHELRLRIPAHVQVIPSPSGSSIGAP
jgi:exonuclease SbcC